MLWPMLPTAPVLHQAAPATPLSLDSWHPDDLLEQLVLVGCRTQQARQALLQLAKGTWQTATPWPVLLATLGKTARKSVELLVIAPVELQVTDDRGSADATRKLLLRTHDGHLIETVVIPSTTGTRTTVCLSSQVGCGRRCTFCETGRSGLIRNLTAGEIVAQLRQAQRSWQRHSPELAPIRNVVFMGMGEPLDNLAEVATAVAVLTHDRGAGLSWRHVTVSTVGVAHKISAFFEQVQAHLAVSLHAPDDARRSEWMPINARCDLATLKSALLQHLPPGREVLVEYILFADRNSALADAELLCGWLAGLPVRVNLIPANPGPDPQLGAPPAEQVWQFQKYLLDRGIRAMVRHPHGRDIGGACGQLAGAHRREAVNRQGPDGVDEDAGANAPL